jgi:hypothetical protein
MTATRDSGRYRIVIATEGRDAGIPAEGYVLRRASDGPLHIVGSDASGIMYGLLDVAEQLRTHGDPDAVSPRSAAPRFAFRAIKFNLPWMSYRKHASLQLHDKTCRDLAFWERFLDMMARNRFNVLSLWSLHPFTWLIRPKNHPEACGFDDAELAAWREFWKTLFRMAKARGIETYLVNWNIFVSPEFARARNVATYSADWKYFGKGDPSPLVRRYTRECVTQVLDEYRDLTGLGITLGEGMGGMTPREREDWLVETFVEGMRAAKRPVKFIHRAPLSATRGSGGSTDDTVAAITRRAIDAMGFLKGPVWVEMKFNWSHGHSTPRLAIIHGGKASEGYWNPKPVSYRVTWMIRNEDIFLLRWGEPGFIREHIRLNGQDYVGGYFVGSECYIPAFNYLDREGLPGRPDYAFERQWLFYLLWGRLLYDPKTPDAVFEAAFDRRYGRGTGKILLEAFERGSRMPLRLASLFRSTWDFTLYAEGFLAPRQAGGPNDKASPFISVNELIGHAPLDPACVSIADYVDNMASGSTIGPDRITPPRLADALERDGRRALALIDTLKIRDGAIARETDSVRAWSHMSLYFAEKIRGGIALQTFRRSKRAGDRESAVHALEKAARHWDDVVAVTRSAFNEIPLIHLGEGAKQPFSWTRYTDQVKRDIALARKAR